MRRICIAAFEGGQSLDITGPLEVFSTVNAIKRARESVQHRRVHPSDSPLDVAEFNPIASKGQNKRRGSRSSVTGVQPEYEVRVASRMSGPICMSSGLRLLADSSIARIATPLDTLIVAGSPSVRGLLKAASGSGIGRVAGQSRRVAAVCTGAFVLADCGLLANKRATTHWGWCQQLSTYPDVTVDANALYVRDGNVWTSGGVTAGIDLALAMVEEDHGTDMAREVARQLVFFLRRPGGQSQFDSLPSRGDNGIKEPMQSLLAWVAEHLSEDLSIETLATRVGMSPRNFARSFVRCVGETPARAVERARVEAACRLLERTDDCIDLLAERCGFGTPETMRRAFLRQLKVPPSAYRRRFSTSHRAA